MPRFAVVELYPNPQPNKAGVVINVANASTVPPPASSSFRHLVENLTNPTLNDWTPGNEPRVGDEWNGGIPALFTAPEPLPDAPTDVPTAVANVRVAQAELDRRMDQLDTLLGTAE